jgi:hypothetical protein
MLWCCRDWIFQSIVSTCPCAFPAPLVQPARLCKTRWLYIKTSSPSCFSLSSLPALRCYSPKTHRHCEMSGSAAVFQKYLRLLDGCAVFFPQKDIRKDHVRFAGECVGGRCTTLRVDQTNGPIASCGDGLQVDVPISKGLSRCEWGPVGSAHKTAVYKYPAVLLLLYFLSYSTL